MCSPSAFAMFALTATSAAASYAGKQQQAAYMEKMNEVNAESARQDMVDSMEATNRRQSQENEAATNEVWNSMKETRAARARARVAAGEGGVSGSSVEAVIADIDNDGAVYQDSVRRNQEMTMGQLQRSKTGAKSTYQNRLNNQPRPQKPDLSSLFLQVGSGAADSYAGYKSRQP